jgi:hypothetical protein
MRSHPLLAFVLLLTLGAAPAPAHKPAAPATKPAPARAVSFADAESAWAQGRFDDAQRAFTGLYTAKGGAADTLVALRLAALRLLRDDRRGAREVLDALLAKAPDSRSARVLLAEAYVRDLDFAHAAPLERALGREAFARQLESFTAATPPYRIEGPAATSVPFVQTDPLPLLEVRVGGRGPYFFLIDTGASELIVDPALVDSLQLPTFGEEEGTFAGGRKRAYVRTRVNLLALGEFAFSDLPAMSVDLSRFAAAAGGRRVSGIIGTLLLMRCRATLDYPSGKLVLERRGAAVAADTGAIAVPFWIARDHYLLARGRMGPGPEGLWFVDTGLAGAGVAAPASTLTGAGVAVPDTSSGPTGMGGGGSVKIQPFPVDRFQLGDATSGGLTGVFGAFPPALERGFGYPIAGIISHQFFRPYRVTFDFDAMRLRLKKG